MKINQIFLSIVVIVIIFGAIFITKAVDLWQTKNTKIPQTYQSGEFKGQYDPSDIRGSYTFSEVSELYQIPLEDLGNAFAVQSNFSSFQCKDLESIYVLAKVAGKEVGTDSVSLFVALYKGLPITINDATYLPNKAESILLNAGKMTEEQKTFIASHLTDVEKASTVIRNETSTENPSFVKGKTTFLEVLAIGVKKEAIETALNTSIVDTSAVIRDFCTARGLEFTDVKAKIQTLIDQK